MQNLPSALRATGGRLFQAVMAAAVATSLATAAQASPRTWSSEWPNTDFSKANVQWNEILSGGPPRDGIPPIDDPKFKPVSEVRNLGSMEPVVGVTVNGKSSAYPLRVLTWHEIVNDDLGGIPITVTYCPLCNSSIVFDRRIKGMVLDFGTTGKLRNSDLVMYDRQTESWWQQFIGTAIVGEMTGTELEMLPSRLESFANFKARAPEGEVLLPPPMARSYGANPYVGYDTRKVPYGFFNGPFPEGIEAMVRVVAVDGEAWSLPLLREKDTITKGDLTLRWTRGQNSALDTRSIAQGRDVGNVVVTRKHADGERDEVHDVTFAFVFHVFHPEGTIHHTQ